jgi:hypothetical protein
MAPEGAAPAEGKKSPQQLGYERATEHRTYSFDISSKATRTPSRAQREEKIRDGGISRITSGRRQRKCSLAATEAV